MANNKCARARNWADMEHDILVKIVMTLNFLDVISFSCVCSSWNAACRIPSIWKKFDLTVLKFNFFNTPRKSCTWSGEESSERLTRMLKTSLRLSCGNISSMVFHFSVFINDAHLIYAAERSRGLKQLVLPTWNPITSAGFEKAVKNWKGLESLAVACHFFPIKIMKLIGDYCKNFSELKVMCLFQKDCAKAIAVFTPKLKVLSLQCNMVYKDALVYLLKNMKHLEVVNISHMLLVEDSKSPAYIDVCEEFEYQTIIEQASRVKFLACPRESCSICQNRINDDEERFRWFRFEEPIYRKDEVSTLAF